MQSGTGRVKGILEKLGNGDLSLGEVSENARDYV